MSIDITQESNEISPTLYICKNGEGHGYLGGVPLEREVNESIKAKWMLRNDKPTDSKMDLALNPKTNQSISNLEFPDNIMLLSELSGISVIATDGIQDNSSHSTANSSPKILKFTVQTELNKSHTGSDIFMHKWNSGILLASQTTWFTHTDEHSSYKTYSGFERLFKSPPTPYTDSKIQSIALNSNELSKAQLERLKRDFELDVSYILLNRGFYNLVFDYPSCLDSPVVISEGAAMEKYAGCYSLDLKSALSSGMKLKFQVDTLSNVLENTYHKKPRGASKSADKSLNEKRLYITFLDSKNTVLRSFSSQLSPAIINMKEALPYKNKK